ncbi:MAG: DUF3822 family protein [Prevotella sp.]|nr:DUF3822 family protein [Prevotella sp.]
MINQRKERIIIRIGERHLSFSALDPMQAETPVSYEPYVMKSGISLTANLREALNEADLPQAGYHKALALIDAPVLLIPIEQFEEQNLEAMYLHAFPRKETGMVCYNVLSDLNAVAAFSISKDLNTVLHDNFTDVMMMPLMAPVWRHLHHRSFTGNRNKVYGYFHERKLDIFSFHQNRFKFSNQFDSTRPQDATYFLLYVWKQLMLDNETDEMHLAGTFNEMSELANELRKYVQKVYIVNPSAEFNRAPATKIPDMPFDLMIMMSKGL